MSDTPAGPMEHVRAWWAVFTGVVLGIGWLLRWAWGVNARLQQHDALHAQHERAQAEFRADVKDRATNADLQKAVAAVQEIGRELRSELLYLRNRLDAQADRGV